jgi:metalloendopeptidase OMA1, mitochondrial
MARGKTMRWLLVGLAVLVGCTTVPYTNRSRIMMMSESDDMELGLAAYEQILSEEKISRDPEANRLVSQVGRAIADAADKPEFDWQFTVIDEPETVNAFALPGGKVAVYTGIFPVAIDTAGLATVIGHEVAHALARHGAERMSQGMALQGLGIGLAIATSGQSAGVQQAVMQAYGLGAQVGVLLPFSREMESEADHIGLILMAKAGYDPSVSVGLWERMGQLSDGAKTMEFLSTHPNYDTRIQQLREWIPEAERYYRLATPRQVVALPRVK